MYNNDITYAPKWNIEENQAALKKLEKKYFDKSQCSPDCPVSWAPEVLELMETLDKELGFKYNESTMRGYYIQGTPVDWFIKGPWNGFFSAFKKNIFEKPSDYSKPRDRVTGLRPTKSIFKRIIDIFGGFTHSFGYGFRALIIKYVNPIRNRMFNKRISLGQLKEKYGSLTCYFNAPDAFEEFIENEIRKCEIKLAIKGAYYPLESLWDNSTSYDIENDYRPDSVTVTYGEYKGERTVTLKKTTYRNTMKEMGLDIKEIKEKAEIRAATKDSIKNGTI